jgi:hypothetical protein
MGIENIARAQRISSNHRVTSVHKRCVRLLCEKWRHASQRQPMRELLLLEWLLQALIQSQQPCFDVNGRTVDEYEPSLFTRAASLEE